MLLPSSVAPEGASPLATIDLEYQPITAKVFAEFEGVDPLAPTEQLETALAGAFGYAERHTSQYFRPTIARAYYDIRLLSAVPYQLVLPGYKPNILDMNYNYSMEDIELPNDNQLQAQGNGTVIINRLHQTVSKSEGDFSILFEAGILDDEDKRHTSDLLEVMQKLAKSYYESVTDDAILRIVNSTIRAYKLWGVV